MASSITVKAIVEPILFGILSYPPILTASNGTSKFAKLIKLKVVPARVTLVKSKGLFGVLYDIDSEM